MLDVVGKCNARLFLYDNDQGIYPCVFRCPLKEGHEGSHKEEFERDGNLVTIVWHKDESIICTACGKRQESYGEELCISCIASVVEEGEKS